MTVSHLHNQFHRLHQHFAGKGVETTLDNMAMVLCCTKRNARNVLNKLSAQGWIDWQPATGRSNRSKLNFLCSSEEVKNLQVRALFRLGKIEVLFANPIHSIRLRELVNNQLGLFTTNHHSLLCLGHFANSLELAPNAHQTELSLFCQALLFNGLTECDKKTGELRPSLAHAWQMLSEHHWRFYLQPALWLHDGNRLDENNVIYCLAKLKNIASYQHIKSVCSPASNVIDIILSEPDYHLPYILSLPQAVIYHKVNNVLIGTGPYKISQTTNQLVRLSRHTQPCGEQGLIDQIEIWLLNQASLPIEHKLDVISLDEQLNVTHAKQVLQQGAIYLMQPPTLANNRAWLKLLASLGLPATSNQLLPAEGLLPGFFHRKIAAAHHDESKQANMALPTSLTLAFNEQDIDLKMIGEWLCQILNDKGVKLTLLAVTDLQNLPAEFDLWLDKLQHNAQQRLSQHFFTHPCSAKFLQHNNLLAAPIRHWRTKTGTSIDEQALAHALVQSGLVYPLFHRWFAATGFSHKLQQMSANNLIADYWHGLVTRAQ